MTRPLGVTVVDAFTSTPFAGNPAAVCVTPEPLPDELMQHVAAEMNLSETAFLVPRPDGDWSLRWFTPAREVDLCGHATLASAHVVWSQRMAPACALTRFHTRSGVLSARGEGDWIWIDLPALPPADAPTPPGLADWMGRDPEWVGTCGVGLFVVAPDAAAVAALHPDSAVAAFDPHGVLVSAAGEHGVDVVSRYFVPNFGIPEDPVTGSAHCALGPYWSARLGIPELACRQISPRGGSLRVVPEGERVHIGGQAVAVMRGELHLPG